MRVVLALTAVVAGFMASAAQAQIKIIGQNSPPPVKVQRATASLSKYEPEGDKGYHGASLPDA